MTTQLPVLSVALVTVGLGAVGPPAGAAPDPNSVSVVFSTLTVELATAC